MNKFLFLSIIFFQLSSCSFHSSQYDFIKSLVVDQNNSQKPEKNWTAYWVDRQIDLYAINFENQIIFADENINIFFKDNIIYKVTGLLPNNSVLDIESNYNNKIYYMNENQIAVNSCELGQMAITENLGKNYYQLCSAEEANRSYKNEIKINSEGYITEIRFKIHPDYPLLRLRIK
tara:strand:- start:5882 stop:6409 length:528 start_codon:yes stop_codon:yes gene_type:complete